MLIGLGVLLTPAAYHRIVEQGRISGRFHQLLTVVLAIALLPFAIGLSAAMYVAGERVGSHRLAAGAGVSSLLAALGSWYGLEWGTRLKKKNASRTAASSKHAAQAAAQEMGQEINPKLTDKIKEVLIEARMVLPGAQALLGFQFSIVVMEGFLKIPVSSRYIQFASLSAIALSTIFLIMPAAYHRLAYEGEDSEEFYLLSGRLLLIAMFFLRLGVSGDFMVVCRKVTVLDREHRSRAAPADVLL